MENGTSDQIIGERDFNILSLFYKNGLSKSEIAKTMGVSRQTVSAIIQRAQQKKIVEYRINSPYRINTLLSEKLISYGDIKKAIVVQDSSGNEKRNRSNICKVVAEWLSENIYPRAKIGIGWGQIVSELSSSNEIDEKKDALLVPLLGGFGKFDPRVQVDEIVRKLAKKMNANYMTLYAPIFTKSAAAREAILKSPNISGVIDSWSNLDFAVFSILDILIPPQNNSAIYETMSYENRMILLNKGAVGNICWRYFDHEGNAVSTEPLELYPISISFNNLRKTKVKIGMVNGPERAESVLGAMKGKLVDVLITDSLTADRLIHLYESEKTGS